MTSKLSASKEALPWYRWMSSAEAVFTGFQTNRLGDYKGDSLGLGLTDNLGCGGAALGLVQHLVCFMFSTT